MIENKTAFIIGAGASKAYSFPTGEDLRQEIFNMRVNHMVFGNSAFNNWYSDEKFIYFVDVFKQSGLKSIDTFLKFHSEFENEGKACIAYLIKNHEIKNRNKLYERNEWLFYLYNKIVENVKNPFDIKKNKLYFVTFNYDRILEYYLINSFYNCFNGFLEVKKMFKLYGFRNVYDYFGFEIDHVYGKIGTLETNPIEEDDVVKIANYMNEIKIVGDRSANIENIKNKLLNYDSIYFLGYGYDKSNNELLDLQNICNLKAVYGTCYNYYEEEIEEVKRRIKHQAYFGKDSCSDLIRKYL